MLRLPLLIALCLHFLVSTSEATVVARMNDSDLVRLSKTIVEGTVVDVESVWSPRRDRITTTVTIVVETWFKGEDSRETLKLRMLGGRVGDTVMQVVGAPIVTPGEDVILFVHDESDEELPITGLGQGKLTVAIHPNTGIRMVSERGVTRDEFVASLLGAIAEEERR